jgi:hypothetical protein
MLVFPVWVSTGKISVYCVYFPLYILCPFIENLFVVNNCRRLKSTLGSQFHSHSPVPQVMNTLANKKKHGALSRT